MITNNACLEPDRLSDYVAGKVSFLQQREVEAHLRGCRTCQAAVARCRPDSDSMLRAVRLPAVRQAVLGDSADREPELAAALSAVAMLHAATAPGAACDVAADTGQLIRDYEILRKLGEGGMGAVYLAVHTKLKKRVAIKLLKADRNQDASAIARFAIEIEAVGKLEHPHIVRALDAGEANGVHFLVMEYLAGIDLARLVRGLGPIGLSDTCEIVRQAALGLHHAHQNDVIHRDVKPSNLMLLPTGKVKLLDLGLAHFRPDFGASQGLTEAHQLLGTLLYIAPEQLGGGQKADARADIYSLGVTLYELLLGKAPLRQGLNLSVSPADQARRPEVPPEIWQLAARMTASERIERPASMLDVVEALRPWTAGADLSGLLAQLAGQTTYAAQPATPAPVTPGGQWTTEAAEGLSQWTPIDVAAPPVATGDLTMAAAHSPRATAGRKLRFSTPIAASIGLICLIVMLSGLWLAKNYTGGTGPRPQPAVTAAPAAPAATGVARIESANADYHGLLDALLSQGVVFAEHQATRRRTVLQMGKNSLPEGDYALACSSPQWTIPPQPFTVSSDQWVSVAPVVEFPYSWLHPQLPARAGEFCEYEGRLWHAAFGPPDAAVAYQLTLENLGEQAVAGAPHRWLKVEVRDPGQAYTESAALLIDEQAWTRRLELKVAEGWLLATSAAIAEGLSAEFAATAPPGLAAPFDADRDSLAEAAQRLGVPLPRNRVTVHDALVLLFDAQADAAAEIIRQVRANLPARRTFTLSAVDTPRGIENCLVVTGGNESVQPRSSLDFLSPGKKSSVPPPLYLARSRSIPFSFAKIEVHSPPAMIATLRVRNFSRPQDQVAAAVPPVASYAEWHQRLRTLRAGGQPFNLPDLPAEEGSGVVYQGRIGSLTIRAAVCALGKEADGREEYRWLGLNVSSGEASEKALLLVNEQRYREGEFQIVRGWWQSQGETFPFPPHDIGPIEEGLLRLDKELPATRLGVHDVLNLMFDARLKVAPKFDELRPLFAAIRVQAGLSPVPTTEYITLKSGQQVLADVWTLALPAAAGEAGGGYKIVRTRRMPFDFASVSVTAPGGLTMFVEAAPEAGGGEWPEAAELQRLADVTVRRVADREAEQPNRRLWTVKQTPASPAARIWAEYGGKVSGPSGETVLLLEIKNGKPLKVPLASLITAADLDVVRRGRAWQGPGGTLFQGELTSFEGRWLYFQPATGLTRQELHDFEPADQKLIEELKLLLALAKPPAKAMAPKRGRR